MKIFVAWLALFSMAAVLVILHFFPDTAHRFPGVILTWWMVSIITLAGIASESIALKRTGKRGPGGKVRYRIVRIEPLDPSGNVNFIAQRRKWGVWRKVVPNIYSKTDGWRSTQAGAEVDIHAYQARKNRPRVQVVAEYRV